MFVCLFEVFSFSETLFQTPVVFFLLQLVVISWSNALEAIPVVTRSKLWVCGGSLAWIAGSNPAGDMEVCLE
jgi:hypothetical protein